MSKKNKRNHDQASEQVLEQNLNNSTTNNTILIKKISDFFKHPIVAAITATIIVNSISGIISNTFIIPNRFTLLENDLRKMRDSVSALDKTVSENNKELNNTIGELKINVAVLNDRTDTMKDHIFALENKIDNVNRYTPTVITKNLLSTSYNDNKSYSLTSPTWNSSDIIATDSKTGEKYTSEQLAGEKLVFSYIDGKQEVYFLGQYNDNYSWHGDCVINVYENNNLVLIMDAEYNNGELLYYKQVMTHTIKNEIDLWLISERKHNIDGTNTGNTWSYLREEQYQKDFSLDDVEANDIINVRRFKTTINTSLVGYYNGNTSEGLYNDDTGEAYLVRYSLDGTIKTLYMGKFVDGKFDDNTGNAWYITRNDDTDYMYFKGIFKEGVTQQSKNSIFENNLSIQRINEIIEGINFNCKMNWYNTK